MRRRRDLLEEIHAEALRQAAREAYPTVGQMIAERYPTVDELVRERHRTRLENERRGRND